MRLSIRSKLLLASLSLLVVPWLGYQYIQSLERYLRIAHEEKLLDRVSIMAAVMREQRQLLDLRSGTAVSEKPQSHFYVRPLHSPIQLDGYTDDWSPYQQREKMLGTGNDSLSVLQRMGHYEGFLYLLLRVKDNKIIYRQPESPQLDRSDHLRISMIDNEGKFRRYQLATIGPGWVSAHEMAQYPNEMLPLKPAFSIKGEWQESTDGYTVELRVPLNMIGAKFAVAVVDVDEKNQREISHTVASANTEQAEALGTIAVPSQQMESLLDRLNTPLNRIWVVDPMYRVIGMSGSLQQQESEAYLLQDEKNTLSLFSRIMKIFYRFSLQQPSNRFTDILSTASRLDNPAVAAALTGTPQADWRSTGDEDISIVIAAHPIYIDKKIVGVIAIEENSNSILIMQNRMIEAMMNISVVAFMLTIGVLLIFATRLSFRIRKLRNDVDASIAEDGRVQSEILPNSGGDEIGDLGRSFSSMLQRLSQYNRYLETMAGKLGHELRTPVAIVRSSLDNLEQEQLNDQALIYVKRAQEGTKRLNRILTRMSEASYLEQTISHEQREIYFPADVIQSCIEAYRLTHQQQIFELQIEDKSRQASVNGSPELLAQLLDKLVENALDFATSNTPICFSLSKIENQLVLSVRNQGPLLPEEMQDNLFDSMVSVRQHRTKQAHLGLGLYIAHLISEFHHASITASNTTKSDGVVFRLRIPCI